MKKDTYQELFSDMDDRIVEEIAENIPALDDAAKNRIEALCEEKMRMKDIDRENEDLVYAGNIQNITTKQWFRPVLTAAACLLVVCGIGAAVLLQGRTPSVQPAPPLTEAPTIVETGESTAEDVTETTQVTADTETSVTAQTSTTVTEVTGITESEVVTETTIMTAKQTETMAQTETSQEICSVPLQAETLTFSTQTIKKPYPDYADVYRIEISYPQANETSAEADAINALIQERVQAMLNYCQDAEDRFREDAPQYGNDDLYESASCTLHVTDYEITRNDADYLSIVWRGDYYLYSAAHPNLFAQGLVIDKKIMTAVTLSDLYDVNAEMITEELIARSPEALAEKFCGDVSDYADFDVTIYQESLLTAGENIIDGHMFALTDSGIIVDAFITHAIGDYLEIEIPFEALESIRK